ncbi:MAG: DeoR/GlpR family DNA-binding transcription regulator [Treponema sp.]|jgi:DeoR/GlpR family transcriptional regulator of sugar metabolism|nr:DeoR/GlpR family DNA-binding transcription regulator [Treponema sp.]
MTDKEQCVLDLINSKQTASISVIRDAFGYSESTVRRILNRLSNRGRILRYHGGGHSVNYQSPASSVQSRFELRPQEKDRIARAAVSQFYSGDTVVLLGGTTVANMCRYMRGMRITVITNSLLVFDELRSKPETQIILLGGQYNLEEMETRGALTHSNLKMLRANCLFMGTSQFHPDFGFTTTDINTVELYHLCLEASRKKFILADSSKFGESASAVIAGCDMIDCLITDKELPPAICKEFITRGVEVLAV